MKKIILYIVLVFSLIANAYFIVGQTYEKDMTHPTLTMYDKLNSLLEKNFVLRNNDGKKLIVYFGRPGCGDCNKFDQILGEMIDKYKISDRLYYVNVERIHENKSEWLQFKKKYNIKGTPTFAIYNHRKLLTKLDFEEHGGFSLKELEMWISRNLVSE